MGATYRQKNGTIKMTSSDGEKQLPYLKRLVGLMGQHDSGREFPLEVHALGSVVRSTAAVAPNHTSALATKLKREQELKLVEQAKPKDDPLCLQLRDEYIGKLLLDTDEEPLTTYKVIDITYYDKTKPHC